MNIRSRILKFIEEFLYTKTLHYNVIYQNKKDDIYIMVDDVTNVIKVFNKGLLFNIPLILENANSEESIEEYVSNTFEKNLHLASLEELNELLQVFEKSENYEQCAKIKDTIKKKISNEEINKP
jgi:polyribonucleotide nucleotidyltransferase